MALRNLLSYGKSLGFGVLFSLIMACEKDEQPFISEEQKEAQIREHIVNNYYDWARMSKLKDYEGMLQLVAPQSTFEGATEVCKNQWDENGDFYWEFSSVEVESTTKQPPEAYVRGNWSITQRSENAGAPDSFGGGFYSSSFPSDGEYYNKNWLLDGINCNLDRFWWRD